MKMRNVMMMVMMVKKMSRMMIMMMRMRMMMMVMVMVKRMSRMMMRIMMMMRMMMKMMRMRIVILIMRTMVVVMMMTMAVAMMMMMMMIMMMMMMMMMLLVPRFSFGSPHHLVCIGGLHPNLLFINVSPLLAASIECLWGPPVAGSKFAKILKATLVGGQRAQHQTFDNSLALILAFRSKCHSNLDVLSDNFSSSLEASTVPAKT